VHSAPGVLPHRDARRIGPGFLVAEAAIRRCVVCGPFRLAPIAACARGLGNGRATIIRRNRAGDRSRQAVGSVPKNLSVHLAVPKPIVGCRSTCSCEPSFRLSLPSAWYGPAEAVPCLALTTAPPICRRSRASRCICGSRGRFSIESEDLFKRLPRVFSDTAAGIASAIVRVEIFRSLSDR
jgi:hypothetical protein